MDGAAQGLARHEKQLSASTSALAQELHYRLIQGMEEGVVFHDQHGVIQSMNPSAERILQVSASELIGKRSVLQCCAPVNEDGSAFSLERCPALVCLRTGRSERDVVIGIRRPAGNVHWLCFTSHPLTTPDGVRAGVVTSFRDVTELKNQERQSAARYEAVSHHVRLHDAFLATAAHELRTPLTALKLQVQNLLRRLGRDPGFPLVQVMAKLTATVKQAERLDGLIDLLLDVSRMTVGRLELQRAPTDLAEVVREVLGRLSDELTQAGVKVHAELESVVGRWDGARLEQVVSNLVSNALKYGNRQPIHVRLVRQGDVAALAVIDTGLGVPAADHRRIFERFERAHDGQQSGLGLGLWIVREIVEAHGGKVELTSVPDAGSTFTVWLPLEAKELG